MYAVGLCKQAREQRARTRAECPPLCTSLLLHPLYAPHPPPPYPPPLPPSGNLVTNATANHFFLNEGFTMMIERKITARLRGASSFDFSALAGAQVLESAVSQFTARGEIEFTKLVPDLAGVDPDDSFSSVPYEKGFQLLHHIQTIVGEAAFNAYLHDYFCSA